MWRITFLDQRKLFCCRLLNFSLRHKTTPRGVVISQISMKSFTRFHGGEICLIKNQVCKEYNLLLLNSILSLCVCVYVSVCVCVFEWIIAIVFVYTCVVTICRRRYGHVSTAFRIPWIVYRTFLGRTITRSTAFTATSLLPLVFFLLKYLFFYILDPLWYIPPNWKNCTLIPILSSFSFTFPPFLLTDCKISFCISWISSCGTSLETLEELYLDPLRLHRLPFLPFLSY